MPIQRTLVPRHRIQPARLPELLPRRLDVPFADAKLFSDPRRFAATPATPQPPTPVQLTERDEKILDHVARYRLTLREIVQQLFMPEAELNAVTKVMSRLVRVGLLAKHTFHDARRYWTLSARSAEQRGLNERRSHALGCEGAMQHYGVLAFCCGGKAQRQLLTPAEFEQQFPDHSNPHITRTAYYVDEHDGARRLGLADRLKLEIRVAHYPPYCSKYNPIEHRLFPHVTRACQGVVFHTVEVVKRLIEKTKTSTGLQVTVDIIDKTYEIGRKCAKGFKKNMKIVFDSFLPKWNYRAIPTTS